MSSRKNNNNYINLDEFPKKCGFGANGSTFVIDWINSIGCIANFKYANIYGEMKVTNFYRNKMKIDVLYNGKTYNISTDTFINCQFKNIFGIVNLRYKYDINQLVSLHSGDAKILEPIRNNRGKKAYICECLTCHGVFDQEETQINIKTGCKICAGTQIQIGINDMWTTVPDVAKLLLNPEDGYKYTYGSQKEVNWLCPVCGEIIYNKPIARIYQRGLSCPVCGKTKSYPNRFMYSLLRYLNANFKDEKSFKWSCNKKYDFYLKDFNTIIEMHGKQHYDKDMFNTPSEDIQKNDEFKKDIAKVNGIKDYIIIDSRYSNMEWIKNNILESKLINLFDLSNVDWNDIEKKTRSNPLKEICNLWDSGLYDMHKIGKIVGCHASTVSVLLRKGHQLGITTYSPELSLQMGNKAQKTTKYNKISTPFICVENGKCFGSVTICSVNSELLFGRKFETTVISKTLNGKIKSLNSKKQGKPIHFQYITREEFNKVKSESPELAFGDFFILPENQQLA
jgi:hypothetical protein